MIRCACISCLGLLLLHGTPSAAQDSAWSIRVAAGPALSSAVSGRIDANTTFQAHHRLVVEANVATMVTGNLSATMGFLSLPVPVDFTVGGATQSASLRLSALLFGFAAEKQTGHGRLYAGPLLAAFGRDGTSVQFAEGAGKLSTSDGWGIGAQAGLRWSRLDGPGLAFDTRLTWLQPRIGLSSGDRLDGPFLLTAGIGYRF